METAYSSETSANFRKTPYVPEVITVSNGAVVHVTLSLWLSLPGRQIHRQS
jgi:hypothetical protein